MVTPDSKELQADAADRQHASRASKRTLLPIIALLGCAPNNPTMTAPMSQEPVQAEWDFYPCKVDNEPASIFVDLGLLEYAESAPETTLYALHIQMLDSGPHGIGAQSELDALGPVEDAVAEVARGLGARFVGRVRGSGNWQLAIMGPEGLFDAISQAGASSLTPLGREYSLSSQADTDWAYYLDFLYPSPERMRWIQNRRVVDSLKGYGDDLTGERRVDHWIYFDNDRARASFEPAVIGLGFEPIRLEHSGLQIHRVDSVLLDDIHEVTEELYFLAHTNLGNYDGWETSVEN